MEKSQIGIDGRAASDFPSRGLLAKELIDQLATANGGNHLSTREAEAQKYVLISHPQQVFSGEWQRHNTRLKISRSPWHWLWEKQFNKEHPIQALHRFRPIDRCSSDHGRLTLTTLLPPITHFPVALPKSDHHYYIVPCAQDANQLVQHKVPESHISIMRPAIRQYVHQEKEPSVHSDGWALFLLGSDKDIPQYSKLIRVLEERFPTLPRKKIYLNRKEDFSPRTWSQLLSHSKICFYLMASPFDWATLYLEALYWRVPALFPDNNTTLNELLPNSPLKINSYLVNQTEMSNLRQETEKAREQLLLQGVFDPFSLAKQYLPLYERINQSSSHNENPNEKADPSERHCEEGEA